MPSSSRRWCRAAATALFVSLVVASGDVRVAGQAATPPDWKAIEAETLQHFQAILRMDTSNPPGNEYLVTDYIKGVLEKEGIPVQIAASDPKRPNLIARLKGSGRKQPVLYMGHSDVVTVDPKKWTFPPFAATRDGGYIYGRGSLDDKPHVVAGLMTLLTLKRLNVPLNRDVIFLVEAGEEESTGRHRLCRRRTLPRRFRPVLFRRRRQCHAGRWRGEIRGHPGAGESVARHRAPGDRSLGPRVGAACRHGRSWSSRRQWRRSGAGACRSCSTTRAASSPA
ncbi:MAG: M20/M25/M40 family metallo-hydrolase, partial [Vicinamibacterales bacterium]